MKICGIICEYNPLHYGHIKLIDYAKSVADTVVCVMSGNFTQRGESAIADKYDRARHACLAGADLVIELPTIFATSSASDFAYGGISILQSINADYYAFGSECGDISLLNNCADCLNRDSTQLEIARLIDAGNNYPTACAYSLKKIDQKYEIIDKPNNLLGIMYLSTAKQLSYKGIPLTIKRDDNYNNNNLEDIITSSSAIRNNLNSSNLSRYLPPYVDNLCNITDKFNDYARLLLSTSNVQALRNTAQVTEGI
ncbi:MAG: nucleotidyltransferase family protein, partial [Clostridia bacterium]